MRFCFVKVLAALLLILLLFCTACGSTANPPVDPATATTTQTQSGGATTLKSFTLPFAKRDVINPYLAVSELNLQLSALLYEGLFRCGSDFQPEAVLAQEAIEESALQWRITLRTDRVFSNGSPVTAEDVEYSYQKAKQCDAYQERFRPISNLKAEKDGTLRLSLRAANAYITGNLDFPIVPNGSAEEKKLTNAVNGYAFTLQTTPIGSGRYVLKNTAGTYYLEASPTYAGAKPNFARLELFGVTSTNALPYGLEMGNYQFCYDNLDAGDIVRVSAATAKVPLPNLIYLGFQCYRTPLNDVRMRAAIAGILDKTALLSEAYRGYARETQTPFPPEWGAMRAGAVPNSQTKTAAQLLNDMGYTQIGTDGLRTKPGGKALSLSLLVCEENPLKVTLAKAIRNQLQAAGIGCKIDQVAYNEYISTVRNWKFDLYLGEMKLTPNMDLSPLLLRGGAANAGVNVEGKAATAYGQMLRKLISPEDFCAKFNEELPFLPLGFRSGLAAASREMKTPLVCLPSDVFFDIANWK
jgi:peptide/nickel transport system substrate-binding protein